MIPQNQVTSHSDKIAAIVNLSEKVDSFYRKNFRILFSSNSFIQCAELEVLRQVIEANKARDSECWGRTLTLEQSKNKKIMSLAILTECMDQTQRNKCRVYFSRCLQHATASQIIEIMFRILQTGATKCGKFDPSKSRNKNAHIFTKVLSYLSFDARGKMIILGELNFDYSDSLSTMEGLQLPDGIELNQIVQAQTPPPPEDITTNLVDSRDFQEDIVAEMESARAYIAKKFPKPAKTAEPKPQTDYSNVEIDPAIIAAYQKAKASQPKGGSGFGFNRFDATNLI